MSLSRRLLVASLALLLSLAVSEAGMRWLTAPGRAMTATHMADPVLHHRLRPNVSTRVLAAEFRTNSLGLHDREYPARKRPGVFRVLLLGDSFTEGGGLALEATVAKQAEAMLNAGGCRSPLEVANGGVSSYSPILEYLFLGELLPKLEPDLVVVNFDMTDVHDDFIRTGLARLRPDGLPIAVAADRRRETALLMAPISRSSSLRFLEPVERELHRLAIYQAFRRSGFGQRLFGPLRPAPGQLERRGLVGDIRYDPMAITRSEQAPNVAVAWRLTDRYLAGIHDRARGYGASFAVVVYPHAHQVASDESLMGRQRFGLSAGLFTSEAPFQAVEAVGRTHGFPVINLLEHFRHRRATEGSLFWDQDIHHNPRGARVFAEGLVAGLRERRLVPCSPSAPSTGSPPSQRRPMR